MNNLKNSVQLMGYLGADPDFKKLENGSSLAKFRMATNEIYTNKNGDRVETTYWHNCIGWGKQAEVMNQILRKGKEVLVRGKLTYNTYEDKQGNTRHVPEIVVNEFSLTSKKASA